MGNSNSKKGLNKSQSLKETETQKSVPIKQTQEPQNLTLQPQLQQKPKVVQKQYAPPSNPYTIQKIKSQIPENQEQESPQFSQIQAPVNPYAQIISQDDDEEDQQQKSDISEKDQQPQQLFSFSNLSQKVDDFKMIDQVLQNTSMVSSQFNESKLIPSENPNITLQVNTMSSIIRKKKQQTDIVEMQTLINDSLLKGNNLEEEEHGKLIKQKQLMDSLIYICSLCFRINAYCEEYDKQDAELLSEVNNLILALNMNGIMLKIIKFYDPKFKELRIQTLGIIEQFRQKTNFHAIVQEWLIVLEQQYAEPNDKLAEIKQYNKEILEFQKTGNQTLMDVYMTIQKADNEEYREIVKSNKYDGFNIDRLLNLINIYEQTKQDITKQKQQSQYETFIKDKLNHSTQTQIIVFQTLLRLYKQIVDQNETNWMNVIKDYTKSIKQEDQKQIVWLLYEFSKFNLSTCQFLLYYTITQLIPRDQLDRDKDQITQILIINQIIMNAPMPDRMIEKFVQKYLNSQQKQMDTFIKHEQQLKKQRKLNEQKLEVVFERNNQIEEKQKTIQEQIMSSRYQQEQYKVQKERLFNYQELEKQRKEKQKALQELQLQEQRQHEQDVAKKLYDIQQKIKYEEFRKKTDELINKLDANLRKQNQIYLEKQTQKEKYLDEYQSQRIQNLNISLNNNESHFQTVLGNYQSQMQRIQEICRNKVKQYQQKISHIDKKKQMEADLLIQKAYQNKEHINQIQQNHKSMHQNRIQELQKKVQYFQQKISAIEEKRLQNFQAQQQNEKLLENKRIQARAKSENIYRNRSLNLLNKQLEKERSFINVSQQNQSELSLKLSKLNQKWQLQLQQAEKAEQMKQSYIDQLEEKIRQRDLRLQDQIYGKIEIQKQRLKIIEDMEKQKRNILVKLEQDKMPHTNTTEMRYLYTPKQQSKLFIT